MKKIGCFYFVLLVFALPTFVSGEESLSSIYNSAYLVMDTSVAGDIELVESTGATLDYVQSDLYFYPKNGAGLTLLDFSSEPQYSEEVGGALRYLWDDPEFDERLSYGFSARVRKDVLIPKITTKVSFPPASYPREVLEYTRSSETIDSDSAAILRQASLLAEGEDDLYVVVSNIAAWVTESVSYNLSTSNVKASKKASWVLENRQGVCDEITNLFIALLRSLGIPARFVSGIAYTNFPGFENPWGPHGWAEVYFPEYGWVPFDPTYGEFGWVDSSHIELARSIDPSVPSTKFEWKGRNVQLEASTLEITAEVYEEGTRLPPAVSLAGNVFKSSADFGSYNLILANVTNLNGHYVTTEVRLSKTQGIEPLNSLNQVVILKPHETKTVYWKVKISSDLPKGYDYTVPLLLYTLRNASAYADFTISEDSGRYSSLEIDRYLSGAVQEETKRYSRELFFECSAPELVYTYELFNVSCHLKNLGNTPLSDIGVCHKEHCNYLDLPIAQEQHFKFTLLGSETHKKDIELTAENDFVSKHAYVPITLLEEPRFFLENISYPEKLSFDDEFTLGFSLKKTSNSAAYDIKVDLVMGKDKKSWTIPSLDRDQSFVVNLAANQLTHKSTPVTISVQYYDLRDNMYSVEETFFFELEDVGFVDQLVMYVNRLDHWLNSFFE